MSGGVLSIGAITSTINTDLAQDIASGADILTLLTRITAAVAKDSDLATVLARLTAARAGYLDNLSTGAVALNSDMATLLARVTAAVALNSDMATVLARLSAARASYLDKLNVTGNVASLSGCQRGTIVLNAVATNTATITSVNTAKAQLHMAGWYTNSATLKGDHPPSVTFVNGTTVQAQRGGTSDIVTVLFEVFEWY